MRKVTMMMGMLLTLGLFSACSSDDGMNVSGGDEMVLIPEDHVESDPVNEYTGLLYYNEYCDAWFVVYSYPGTYDSVDVYYILNLPDEYKENREGGVNVSFSGRVFEMTDEDIRSLQIGPLGGHNYFYLYLTGLEIVE